MTTVVNHYVADNSTVNICALHISKAFDRVDHFALLQQLMDRNIPRMVIGVTYVLTGFRKVLFVYGGVVPCPFGIALLLE